MGALVLFLLIIACSIQSLVERRDDVDYIEEDESEEDSEES
jgi:hypothetical protein